MQNNTNGTFHLLSPKLILLASTFSWDCIADSAMDMQLMLDNCMFGLWLMKSLIHDFTIAGELVGVMLPSKVFVDDNKMMMKK